MNTLPSDDRLLVTYLDDRRLHPDRRRKTDRRQSGERLPPSATPRPYGFRAFEDRRSGSDRRREALAPLFTAVGAYDPSGDDGPLIDLTAEEIAVLLDRDAP
ncbi:MAG: hypothetical protein MUE49_01840 [Rhodospirillales bacterium]|jgi:hypothetical protein|nr:hypothetical protein [Rhodospirillales bacterium]